jgi:hypothetical protein
LSKEMRKKKWEDRGSEEDPWKRWLSERSNAQRLAGHEMTQVRSTHVLIAVLDCCIGSLYFGLSLVRVRKYSDPKTNATN